MNTSLADRAGTYEIAGKKVARLGFGAMRLTGLGIWGEPEDRAERVRACGAPSNSACSSSTPPILTGPTSQEIIREAIHPYPDDVLIATKAGLTRNGPDVIKQGNELVCVSGPRPGRRPVARSTSARRR